MAPSSTKMLFLVASLMPAVSAAGSLLEVRSLSDRGNQQDSDAVGANPIRKVVSLLQSMAKKIEKEADEEQDLLKKFNCYCKTGRADLEAAISGSTAKVPAVQADIGEAQSTLAQLKLDLVQHQKDREAARSTMEEATALREKEHKAYVAESTELKGYVTALEAAIPAISQGMAGTKFLQGSAATTLASLRHAATADTHLTDDDRQAVLSFLSGRSGSEDEAGYIPRSGEVLGILKDMKDTFDKDLAAVEEQEADAVKTFDELIAAKTKEVETLSNSIEKKTARIGELEVEIVHMKQDLTDTEAALIEDQKFLKDLTSDCEGKAAEYEERVKVRADELAAIHETIKILNDDDALELFKKTLPSASFAQVRAGWTQAKQRVLLLLRGAEQAPRRGSGTDVRFLELALMGTKVDFTKVFKMIDEMLAILKQEQQDDDNKVEYCSMSIDKAEDKSKELSRRVEDLETSIEDANGTIATLKDEINALNGGIEELDKQVMEATEQRKKENDEYTELISSNSAAKELLAFAKNRLNKFYNPTLYKAPETTPIPEEPAFLQIVDSSYHKGKVGEAPPPPPATWGPYQKKGAETSNVISMIDLLIRDLDKEMTEAGKQEEMAQKAYEELMSDSAAKRAKDLKLIRTKESSKADTEGLLTQADGDLSSTKKDLMAVGTYLSQLHGECDWLLQNAELRMQARAEEADALKQAKAILAGADFSLLQRRELPQSVPSRPTLLSRHRATSQ